jgi:hypothetical protein
VSKRRRADLRFSNRWFQTRLAAPIRGLGRINCFSVIAVAQLLTSGLRHSPRRTAASRLS